MNTKTIGDIAVANVLAVLVSKGRAVLLPWGDNERYDLAIDQKKDGFLRVQCKNGRLRNGAVEFHTISTYTGKDGVVIQDYKEDVDAFGVYCAALGKVYLVPIANIGKGTTTLRVVPPKNHNQKNIQWAKDFEV